MEHALKQFRTRNGLSVEEFAKRAGTTRQTIHRIECGKQSPSMAMVSRLIAATGGAVGADAFVRSHFEMARAS